MSNLIIGPLFKGNLQRGKTEIKMVATYNLIGLCFLLLACLYFYFKGNVNLICKKRNHNQWGYRTVKNGKV